MNLNPSYEMCRVVSRLRFAIVNHVDLVFFPFSLCGFISNMLGLQSMLKFCGRVLGERFRINTQRQLATDRISIRNLRA